MIIPESIQNSTERRLIPITKWNLFHVWPPAGGLRHLVFNAQLNGFDHCMVLGFRHFHPVVVQIR